MSNLTKVVIEGDYESQESQKTSYDDDMRHAAMCREWFVGCPTCDEIVRRARIAEPDTLGISDLVRRWLNPRTRIESRNDD